MTKPNPRNIKLFRDSLIFEDPVQSLYFCIVNTIGSIPVHNGFIDDFSGLSEEARTVLLLENFLRELVNGGTFDQFFYNSSGIHTDETIKLLGEFGAVRCQRLLMEAKSYFPPEDEFGGGRENVTEQIEARWDELSDQFFEPTMHGDGNLEDEATHLERLCLDYIRLHPTASVTI